MALGNRRRKKVRELFAIVKQVAPTGLSVGEDVSYDFQEIQNSIDNAADGDKINLDKGVFNGNLVINKKVFIQGSGSDTIINGTVTLQDGSSGSMFKNVKFADNVTVDNLVKNVIITDCWISTGKTLTDNNSNTDDSLYLLLEEV